MAKRILIVYSTWAGSTKEIADFIAKSMEKVGLQPTVISAKEKVALTDYQAAILGTSIHAGRTVSTFRKFLQKNAEYLENIKVAYFVSCANLINENEDTRIETSSWLEKTTKAFPNINPISVGLFAGATITSGNSFESLNIFLKRIIKIMDKNMASEYGKSDFRDWEKISIWTEELIDKI